MLPARQPSFCSSTLSRNRLQMTVRGGGNPRLDMAIEPRVRMGPPPRSFAADAYDCIMVQVPARPTGYKFVARCSRLMASSPRSPSYRPAVCHGPPPDFMAPHILGLTPTGLIQVQSRHSS